MKELKNYLVVPTILSIIRSYQLEVSINNIFEQIKSKVLNELQETIKNIVRKETLSS